MQTSTAAASRLGDSCSLVCYLFTLFMGHRNNSNDRSARRGNTGFKSV